MDIRELPLKSIIPSRTLRTQGTDVQELAESIRQNGLLQPIRVRPISDTLFQIIAGHRRFQAYQLLGHDHIEAIVVDESDQNTAIQSVVENLQREDLLPIELAQGIRELYTGFSLSIDEIAKAVSKSPTQVQTWIRLSRLPSDVLERLESGDLGTHRVTGVAPRHLQPFVRDMPSEEEVERNPEAAIRFEEVVRSTRKFVEEADKQSVHVTAHMADEVARRVRAGKMTISEAVAEVSAHPELYRYGRQIESPYDIEKDTWQAYQEIHKDIATLVYRLRPEIAISFSEYEKDDLIQSLEAIKSKLLVYQQALESRKQVPKLEQV